MISLKKIFHFVEYNDKVRDSYENVPIILLIISELSLFIIKKLFIEKYDIVTQYLKVIFFLLLIAYIFIFIKENIIFNYAFFLPLMLDITKNKYGIVDAGVTYILFLIIVFMICTLTYNLRIESNMYYYNSYKYRKKYKYLDFLTKIELVLLVIYLVTRIL